MKITSLMCTNPITGRTADTLERAAQLMWEHDVGWLPILDDEGQLAGVVTDRDICMAAYTRGQRLRAIPVTTAMTPRVHACDAHDDVRAVEQTMRAHQVRRMPVVDDRGRTIGIVSLNDLARASTSGKLPPHEVTATLAAICAPRELAAAST